MRRKAGIVIGACAALALAGSTGAAAWNYSTDDSRPVGRWQDAPASTAVPDLGVARRAVPDESASPDASSPAEDDASFPAEDDASSPPEKEPESAPGRQRTGELLPVDKVLGYHSAAQTFHYPAASYVKLHFNRVMLLPGDYLTVSNPEGTESYRYDTPTSDEWAMSVTGDTARLQVHRAAGAALVAGSLLSRLGVDVDRVARGFTPVEQRRAPGSQPVGPGHDPREESVCGGDESADAVCYKSADPVAYTRSQAIVRLLINGTELCTGWRVGAENRLLTNNHCFSSAAEARKTEVWFNYQCTKCRGQSARKPVKVRAAQVLATDHTYDYTLFTVTNFPSVRKFGFLSFDPYRPVKGQELYVPQHPSGEPTRIAGALGDKAGTCVVADNRYDGYVKGSDVAYYCDTEGGSSGSPVLSRKTNKVVALHHFGGCPNSGVRGDLLFAKLKSLL